MTRGAYGAESPRAARRGLTRAQLWLFHRDLGALLGNRFLYLAHQGRLSGLRHEIVLEIARLDFDTGEAIVFAARGNRDEWVRNLRAGRALEIRVRHLRFPEPEHRFLPAEECRSELATYARSHSLSWRLLAGLSGFPRDPKNDDLGSVRAVAFRPNPHRDTPDADD